MNLTSRKDEKPEFINVVKLKRVRAGINFLVPQYLEMCLIVFMVPDSNYF